MRKPDFVCSQANQSWSLSDIREAVSDEMEGRGLWVFMEDGAPVDPEEEDNTPAASLNQSVCPP